MSPVYVGLHARRASIHHFYFKTQDVSQVIFSGSVFQQLSNGPQYEKQQKPFICCIISVIRNKIGKKKPNIQVHTEKNAS